MVRYNTSSRSLMALLGLLVLLSTSCRMLLSDVVLEDEKSSEVPTLKPIPSTAGDAGADVDAGALGADGRPPVVLVYNCPDVGQFYCDRRALQECVEVETGTEWLTRQVCASPSLCVEQPADCLPQLCESGELRCNEQALESCGVGLDRWSPLQFCETAGHCDNVVERACRLAPCIAGERRCNDGALEQCAEDRLGYEVVQTCASQALCELTEAACAVEGGCTEVPQCAAPVCEVGETRCDGAEFQRCNLGRTGFETDTTCVSAELCSAGPVVQGCQNPACAPGQHQCSGALLEICAPGQHQFESKNTCINSAHCDPVAGECGAADCQVGERRCNGRRIEVCNADQTAFERTGEAQCASAALCRNNGNNQVFCRQPACQPNQFSCNDVRLQRCNGDQTAFVSAGQADCATPQLCSPAERRCRPPLCRARFNSCDGTRLLTCPDSRDRFDLVSECANQGGCNPVTGQCGDPCLIGQPRCNGSIVERCDDPNVGWRQVAFCASDQLCNSGVAQGRCAAPACTAGEVRCRGNQLQRCNSGRTGFDTIQTCSGNQICDASGAQCDNCAPNSFSCRGNQLRRCSSDGQRQLNQEDCPSANLCSAEAGRCFRCEPAGSFRCAGGQNLFQCADDQSGENQIQVCREPGLCRANANGGRCLECAEPGQRRCVGSDVRSCTNQNTEFTTQTCVNAALCDDNGNGGASCRGPVCRVAGDFLCNEEGELRRCSGNLDSTIFVDQCETPELCNNEAGRCDEPVCTQGQRQCDGSQVFTCNEARNGFVELTPCASEELCQDENDGQAVCLEPECREGDRRCVGSELQECSPGLDGFVRVAGCDSNDLCESTRARGVSVCDTCSEARCNGDTLQQCINGQPVDDFLCEFGCSSARCEICSEGDCEGGNVCSQNTCVVCVTDGPGCPGQQCRDGVECVECTEDGHCEGACVDNSCVQCRNDANCDDGDICTNDTCRGGSCQFSGCNGDTPECGAQGCEASCIDGNCPFGCDTQTNSCSTTCIASACTGGSVGDCTVGVCIGNACGTRTTCANGESCVNGSCQPPQEPCAGLNCQFGCDVETNSCSTICLDSACTGGSVDECTVGACVGNACGTRSLCTGDQRCFGGTCRLPCEGLACAFGCDDAADECNLCNVASCANGCNGSNTACLTCGDIDCTFRCDTETVTCIVCTDGLCGEGQRCNDAGSACEAEPNEETDSVDDSDPPAVTTVL